MIKNTDFGVHSTDERLMSNTEEIAERKTDWHLPGQQFEALSEIHLVEIVFFPKWMSLLHISWFFGQRKGF